MFASSSRPWIVPSSPYGPWSIGKMTSRERPVTTAAGTSASRFLERSMDRIVSSLGRATKWTSRPSRIGLEVSTRACSMTSPAIMPVGTRGAVKGITFRDVEDAGAEIILGNTYHLHLRPGDALIARAGGLHKFIGWPHPILTDSGGYQVFSLAAMRKVTEDGVEFRSHLDGAPCALSPESGTDTQARLGS